MRRRDFIRAVSGAALVWPIVGRAQQPVMPVVAVLSALPREFSTHLIAAWRRGLSETGFVEGRNVAVEYRFVASGQYEGLPGLAAELVKRPVGLIVTNGSAGSARRKNRDD